MSFLAFSIGAVTYNEGQVALDFESSRLNFVGSESVLKYMNDKKTNIYRLSIITLTIILGKFELNPNFM
jgi:hypothetical protein